MKRLVFTGFVTVAIFLLLVLENRFLFGISSLRPGMTQHEAFGKLGYPEFFETMTDNWYILRFYPFVLGAMNLKFDMRYSMRAEENGRTGERLILIGWKPAFCLDDKANIYQLTH